MYNLHTKAKESFSSPDEIGRLSSRVSMKKRAIPLLASLLALSACSKTENVRFEIARTEKGLVRLDKMSGEMVAIDQHMNASLIDLSQINDPYSSEPLLEKVKPYPELTFPVENKVFTFHVITRWRKGKLEFRASVVPYHPGIRAVNTGTEDAIVFSFIDRDGYEVLSLEPVFSSGHTTLHGDQKALRLETSTTLSKEDYNRIAECNARGKFSDATKTAIKQ